jgi:type IX secretion system PorP/SprF family membrane protein
MGLKSRNQVIGRVLFVVMITFSFHTAEGQQTPLYPFSYWVFTPYIYNPAIAGSKDFLSIGANASFQGKSNTQLISGNMRISKAKTGYFLSPEMREFKNTGIGGSVFRDVNGLSTNLGISAAASYQIPLSTSKLSFLSFGAAIKGVYNTIDYDTTKPDLPAKKTFYPNADLGIYYFSTNFFIGVSAVNLLGNPEKPDSLGNHRIPLKRQYYFTTGYKILLEESMNIVLEPSVLIFANDSAITNISDNINPVLKLYVEDFCFGTSFRSGGNYSFFTQFRYPKFFVGAFYEVAKKSPYFKKEPIFEFTLGINIQPDKSRLSNHSHW